MADGRKCVLVKVCNNRNFRVTFPVTPRGDFREFRERFESICRSHSDLQHTNFVFQIHDDQFGCNVQLTEEDDIPNSSVLEAYTVHELNVDESLVSPHEDLLPSDVCGHSPSLATTSQEIIVSTPAVSKKKTGSTLSYPCAIPRFPSDVVSAISENKIGEIYNKFVKASADFLRVIAPSPNKQDYNIFCRTLSDAYPFLLDKITEGVTPYAHFKKVLTASIRNIRYYDTTQRPKLSKKRTAERIIEVSSVSAEDLQMHVAEMKNHFATSQSIDTRHVSALMKNTERIRTSFIKSADNIADVQEEYPALKHQKWIVNELDYLTKTTAEERRTGFAMLIKKLCNLRELDENNLTDLQQMSLLQWLEAELALKSHRVQFRLLTQKMVGDPPISSCSSTQGPFAVLYFDGENISEICILAQGGIISHLQKKSVFDALETLLACYFVYDYSYPVAYPLLTLLQVIILQIPVSKVQAKIKKIIHLIKD